MLVAVQTAEGERKVRVCDNCQAVCIPGGRFCSCHCSRAYEEKLLNERRVYVNGEWLWKCEAIGCNSPELVQGLCHHHCAVCPECSEGPCNGLVENPICNVCIMAFAPPKDNEAEYPDGTQTACSRECIEVIAEKTNKTSVVLPI